MSPRLRLALLVLFALLCVALTYAIAPYPIPQDPCYHRFADRRTLVGIPHAWNVLSNLGFLLVAVYGLMRIREIRKQVAPTDRFAPAFVFILGNALTAVGSAVYHYHPHDPGLLVDRLGMAVAFAGFLAVIFGDRIQHGTNIALVVFLIISVGTAVAWYFGEEAGRGDLRPWGVVQFLPLVTLLFTAAVMPPSYRSMRPVFIALGFYVLAKAFESGDVWIYERLRLTGGHALKHIASAAGALWIVRWLATRQRVA